MVLDIAPLNGEQ